MSDVNEVQLRKPQIVSSTRPRHPARRLDGYAEDEVRSGGFIAHLRSAGESILVTFSQKLEYVRCVCRDLFCEIGEFRVRILDAEIRAGCVSEEISNLFISDFQ